MRTTGRCEGVESLALDRYNPIGETDSERAFCWMLGQILRAFEAQPEPADLFATVARLGSELSAHGVFNFLLSNGDYLFARCDTKLHHIIRRAPFGRATLTDEDVTIDFAQVTSPDDRVAVVATAPLTRDERWRKGEPGELWVFQQGELVAELASPVQHGATEHP